MINCPHWVATNKTPNGGGMCLIEFTEIRVLERASPVLKDDWPRSVLFNQNSIVRRAEPSRKREASLRWAEVVETWTFAERALNFVSSVSSGFLGTNETDSRTLALRVLSCHGNEHDGGNVPACPSRGYSLTKQFHFCNDCGCGERAIARISEVGSELKRPLIGEHSVKLHFRILACQDDAADFQR